MTVGAVSLAAVLTLTVRTDLYTMGSAAFRPPIDHHKYIYMAQHNPFEFHIAPFCWRVLVPLLAKILPFSLQTNFLLIAVVSIWLTAVVTYALCRQYGFDEAECWFGVLLFLSAGNVTKGLLQDFWLTDPLSLLLGTLAIYCIVTRREWGFLLALAAGVAAREFVLLVAPLRYSLRARRWIDGQAAWQALLLSLPAVLVLAGLHVLIAEKNGDPAYLRTLAYNLRVVNGNSSSLADAQHLIPLFGHNIRHISAWASAADAVLWELGLLVCVLAVVGAVVAREVVVRFAPLLILSYLQLFFFPTARYVAIAAPVAIVLAVFGARALTGWLRVPFWSVVGLPLLLLALIEAQRSADSARLVAQAAILVVYAAAVAGYAVWRERRPV